MDITNFLVTTGVTFDAGSGASFEKLNDKLVCSFGEYARVVEKPNYVEGNEFWGLVDFVVPSSFSTYAPRFITYDNYQQNPSNTTRIAVMAFRDGSIHLVSNRGQSLRELASTTTKLPFGKRAQLALHVKLGSVSALTELYMDGALLLSSTKPNIDKGTVIGRARLAVDGAAGATSKSITFFRLYSGLSSPLQTERQRVEAQLAEAKIARDAAYTELVSAQNFYSVQQAEVERLEALLATL